MLRSSTLADSASAFTRVSYSQAVYFLSQSQVGGADEKSISDTSFKIKKYGSRTVGYGNIIKQSTSSLLANKSIYLQASIKDALMIPIFVITNAKCISVSESDKKNRIQLTFSFYPA